MQEFCPSLVRGKVIRSGLVDECGFLVPGPDNLVVTDGMVSVTMTPVNDTGTAITLVNANGEQEVDETPRPRFKRFDVAAVFSRVNPRLLAMWTNQETWEGVEAGKITGFTIGDDRDPDDAGVFLEMWSGVAGRVCADGRRRYGYFGLPWLGSGAVDSITWGNDNISFNVTGMQTLAPNQWGVGPFDVTLDEDGNPAPLRMALGDRKHFIFDLVGLAPPDTDCDTQALGVPATAITEVEGGAATLTPSFSYPPADLAALQASSITKSPTTAWDAGSYVELQDGTTAHWSGSAWVAGPA